jgi:hypothetical protein
MPVPFLAETGQNGVGVGLIDLVDRDDERHAGGLGVVDRFLGLRHHAIVGRDDQDDNVGRLGAAGTHRREGLVTRGVEEGDHAAIGFDVVGTDVLGNAAGFARRHLGAADVVEQRGLAVVDVAHDRHHRGARLERYVLVLAAGILEEGVRVVQLGGNRLVAHFLDHDHRRLLVEDLVDGDHGTHLHHDLDDLDGLDRHLVGKVGDRDGLRHVDFAHDRLGRRLEAALTIVGLVVLAVAVSAILPGRTRIGAARLDPRLALAVVGAAAAALLGILAGHVGLAVQRTLLRRRLRLGLIGSLLARLGGRLGRSSRFLCLLAEAGNLRLALLLFLEFAGLALKKLVVATILVLATAKLIVVDHRCRRRGCGDGWCRRDHLGERLAALALDEDALLAHFDLHRTGTALGIGGLDFRGLLASQGDLGLRLVAVSTAQVLEEPGLVLIGQCIADPLLADAGLAELLEQRGDGHLEFIGELRNGCCCHVAASLLTRTSEPVP